MPTTTQPQSFGAQLLQTVGGGIGGDIASGLGGLMGLAFQGEQNANQISQAEKLGQIQVNDSEQLASYNEQEQQNLWDYTNYPNQVKQLEQAGLNPALLYARGGGGGTTGVAAPVTQGQQAPSGNPVAMGLQLGAQNAETMADIKLKNAQANKLAAETPSGGAGTLGDATLQNIETNTASLAQGIQNQKAQEALTKVTTTLEQYKANIANVTQDKAIEIINETAATIHAQMQSAEVQATIDLQSQGDKIATIMYNMTNAYLTSKNIGANTDVADQIAKLSGQYAQAAMIQANASKTQAKAATSNANTNALQQQLNERIQTITTGGAKGADILQTILHSVGIIIAASL